MGKLLRRAIQFVLIWLGGSGLVVGAILRPVVPGGWYAILPILALAAVPVTVLARGLSCASYPSSLIRLFVLRPFWYAMLFLPLLAIAGTTGAALGLPFGAEGPAGRWTVAVAAGALGVAAVAGYLGSRRLVVVRLEARLPRLPAAFEGLTIVQISDLHVGPHTPTGHLARVAAAVREARPDLIAVTGDQVDDFSQDVARFVAAFGSLTAPLGVVAIAGNHDVFGGWDAISEGLSRAGMTVLVNEAVSLERDGHRLWLGGTGDPTGRMWPRGGGTKAAPDIDRTLAAVPPGEPVIVLAHNPALWPALFARGVDLTLSGHTHYGQLAIPRWQWCAASPFIEFAMRIHRRGDSLLYINPGTNYWGIPFRIGTPPEVTVLTLRRGPARIA